MTFYGKIETGQGVCPPTEILAQGTVQTLPAVRFHALMGTARSVADPALQWLSSIRNKHSDSCVQNTERISEFRLLYVPIRLFS